MPNGNVGAGILNIITESLYDKPIVVFREYVQNSVDSFQKLINEIDLISQIWYDSTKNNLYFLDNGNGIDKKEFFDEMVSIGLSKKERITNIGYKGIGRLSGFSYCNKLTFINICSYKNNDFQKYIIYGDKYNELKAKGINELSFEELMNEIGEYSAKVSDADLIEIQSDLASYKSMFDNQDKGFLVILENINFILKQTIEKEDFILDLGWLLPVKFNDELFDDKLKESQLFNDMSEPIPETGVVPAKAYKVLYNHKKQIQIERPISAKALRNFTCKTKFSEYAIGFHSFNRDKIQIIQKNEFSGIKLYIDNMLLCDETELIPILQQYGLIKHSSNELIQTVKGIGAIIYIVDKVNISANARRTFIEVTDSDSHEFLKLLAEFVESIYDARYALSGYYNEKNNFQESTEKFEQLKEAANAALQKLARDEITIDFEDSTPAEFKDLNPTDQKKAIKKKLASYTNGKIKDYLTQTSVFDYDNVIVDFRTWFTSNK